MPLRPIEPQRERFLLGEAKLLKAKAGPELRGLDVQSNLASLKVENFKERERAIDGVALRNHSDGAFRRRPRGEDVDSVDERLSRSQAHLSGEYRCSGGLSGAVGSEQSEELSCANAKIEGIDGIFPCFGVSLGELNGFDYLARS